MSGGRSLLTMMGCFCSPFFSVDVRAPAGLPIQLLKLVLHLALHGGIEVANGKRPVSCSNFFHFRGWVSRFLVCVCVCVYACVRRLHSHSPTHPRTGSSGLLWVENSGGDISTAKMRCFQDFYFLRSAASQETRKPRKNDAKIDKGLTHRKLCLLEHVNSSFSSAQEQKNKTHQSQGKN